MNRFVKYIMIVFGSAIVCLGFYCSPDVLALFIRNFFFFLLWLLILMTCKGIKNFEFLTLPIGLFASIFFFGIRGIFEVASKLNELSYTDYILLSLFSYDIPNIYIFLGSVLITLGVSIN